MPQVYDAPTGYRDAQLLVATSVANLREQTPPSFAGASAGTQTYAIAIVLGGASAFAANAAVYAWDATSAAADNNSTVIRPNNAQVGGNPGRWRMLGGTL